MFLNVQALDGSQEGQVQRAIGISKGSGSSVVESWPQVKGSTLTGLAEKERVETTEGRPQGHTACCAVAGAIDFERACHAFKGRISV